LSLPEVSSTKESSINKTARVSYQLNQTFLVSIVKRLSKLIE
jgi:hypothetical protein